MAFFASWSMSSRSLKPSPFAARTSCLPIWFSLRPSATLATSSLIFLSTAAGLTFLESADAVRQLGDGHGGPGLHG